MSEIPASEWDTLLSGYPDVHILQTGAWGKLKSQFGWEVFRLAGRNNGAQILFRRIPFGRSVGYIPRGPVGNDWLDIIPKLDSICQSNKCIFLKVEPDIWETNDEGVKEALTSSFQPSTYTIQPSRTIIVNLKGSEDVILARMKQKTRYNVRLALKRGVVVRPIADVELFSGLMQITGERDQFGVHSLEYYQRAYELFHSRGECELLMAEYEGQPLAAVMIFAHGHRAWYFYGASDNQYRELMPTYLIQWEAMRWARSIGCEEYDLWGVPDFDAETLEANFTSRKGGLWGVYRFKRGFGGDLRRTIGSWDRVYNPILYAFYLWWIGKRQN